MTVWTVVTGVAVLIAAGIVARGAAAKETLRWLKERNAQLENDLNRALTRIRELETRLDAVEKIKTNEAAIEHFTSAIAKANEASRKEHAELAEAIRHRRA